MIYTLLTDINDKDIPQILSVYNIPSVSRYVSIDEDSYWNYVTETPNVFFYKVFDNGNLVATTHLELADRVLYMDIVVFPQYQNRGIGTSILGDIKNKSLSLDYSEISVSIDESNIASIKLFEKSGFKYVGREDELLDYIYHA